MHGCTVLDNVSYKDILYCPRARMHGFGQCGRIISIKIKKDITIMRKLIKYQTIIIILALLLSIIPIIMLSPYIYAQADDFSYAQFTHNAWVSTHNPFAVLVAALKTVPYYYVSWQGTYTSEFFMALEPGLWNQEAYHIVPILMIIMLGVATYYFIKTIITGLFGLDQYISIGLTMLILFVSIQCIKQPAEAFTWYNGAIHYTGIYALWLVLLTLNIKMLVSGTIKKRQQIALCITALVVAGGNNLTVLAALIVQVYMLIFLGAIAIYKEKIVNDEPANTKNGTDFRKLLLRFVPETICLFVGAAINFLAPGNAVRMEAMGGNPNGVIETVIKSFMAGIKYSIVWTLSISSLLYIIWFIPFALVIVQKLVDKYSFKFRMPGVLILAGYCLFSAMWAPNLYTSNETDVFRTQNFIYLTYVILLSITVTYLIGWIYVKFIIKENDSSIRAEDDRSNDDKNTKILIKSEILPRICSILIILSTLVSICIIVVSGSLDSYTSGAAYMAVKSGDADDWAETIRYNFGILEDDTNSNVRLVKPESSSPIITSDEIDVWRYGLLYYYDKDSVLYDYE